MMKVLVATRGSLSTKQFVLSRSIYSRVLEPLIYLRDSTDSQMTFEVMRIEEINEQNLVQFDVIVFCKHNTESSVAISRMAKEKGLKVVYDIDDLIYRFTKDSLAFDHMKNVGYLKEHMETADVVVISTQTLSEVLDKDFTMKSSVVIRTGIDVDRHQKEVYAPTRDNVLFTNGDNIKVNSFKNGFVSVFSDFLNQYPQIEFDVFGDSESYLTEFSRYRFLGSLPWPEHKEFLAKHQYTFAIIPLGSEEEDEEHQLFSKCKTPIKYLEYAALRIPGVYSNAFIYKDVVKDHETGLLVDNTDQAWKQALEEMHSDSVLRKKITDRAFDDVYQNHHIKYAARQWRDVFAHL